MTTPDLALTTATVPVHDEPLLCAFCWERAHVPDVIAGFRYAACPAIPEGYMPLEELGLDRRGVTA